MMKMYAVCEGVHFGVCVQGVCGEYSCLQERDEKGGEILVDGLCGLSYSNVLLLLLRLNAYCVAMTSLNIDN